MTTTPLDLNYYRTTYFHSRDDMEKAIHELCAEVGRLRKIPEGYVLVPVEPTEEMCSAGDPAGIPVPDGWTRETFEQNWALAIYKAMIAAAPKDKP